MTRDDFARLYDLQGIDSAIHGREVLLSTADDGSAIAAELAAAQAELERLQEQLHQQQARHRKLELDLATILADRKERSDRCYGGAVTDPKELSALARKIDELSRNADRHEDMILELLEEIERTEQAVTAAQSTVDRLTREHGRIVEHYEQATSQARQEIAELQVRRRELVQDIDEGLVREYEVLRARLQGVAVAALRDGRCSVCNVGVPRSRQPMLERGTAVVKCESCRRILVIPETEQ
ncbi:MAG: zinc ribbon domain-containing protein [Armatimonadota bacterium]